MRKSLKKSLPWAWGLLVALALLPLLRPGLWAAHDTFHHLFRSFDLDYALRGGSVYPRWLPNLGFFYGYPVLNFYAPLGYYLIVLLHWLGTGFIAAMKLAYVVSFVASFGFAYLWGREVWGQDGGLWVAVAYTYFPYHIANAYVRGAIAEHLAMAFFPLILWLLHRIVERENRSDAAYLAIAIAGLIMTHNLSAFMFLPFAALYFVGLLLIERKDRSRAALEATFGGIAGVLLSAFYWLPAVLDTKWIRAGQVAVSVTEPLKLLSPVFGMFSPFLIQKYTPKQGAFFQHPYSQWQVLLMLLGFLAGGIVWRHLKGKQKAALALAAILEVLVFFLMIRASRPLWVHFRPLVFLQFPWRFQGVAGVFSSLAVGAIPLAMERLRIDRKWVGTVALIAVTLAWAATSMLGLELQPLTWPENGKPVVNESDVNFHSMAQYDYQTALWAKLWGGPWLLEYLPVTEKVPREEFWLPRKGPSPWQRPYAPPQEVTLGEQCPLSHEFVVNAPADTYIRWHQFWFPGWNASVDGRRVETSPSPQLGLVTVPIPKGKHDVRIWFGGTFHRAIGDLLSAAATLLLVLWMCKSKNRTGLVVLALAALAWLAIWGVQNRLHSTCTRPSNVWARVEDKAALLGCDSYRSDGHLYVQAYWIDLKPMDEDLTVFIHADDGKGKAVAQHDGPPCESFSPTSRWEPGEIVPDRHLLRPKDDAKLEDAVRFEIGMYRLKPAFQNLGMTDRQGRPIGISWTTNKCGK